MEQSNSKRALQFKTLLDLPNEVLVEVISFLSIPNIRILGRSSRKLRILSMDYLTRCRYSTGIFVLPGEIILEIAQYLRHPRHLTRFARATQWYYPLITKFIALDNIRYHNNSLLCYAAEKNLISMARTIVRQGGDVNKELRSKPLTALYFAARRGHTKMVKLLLSFGASQTISGERKPLLGAIFARHESTALLLSRDILPCSTKIDKHGGVALHKACKMKLVRLIGHYLGDYQNTNPSTKQVYNSALRIVVEQNLSSGNIIRREIHQDVYQIVLMLLHHGADRTAASDISSRHADPRVRAILANPVPQKMLEVNWEEVIGRPWLLEGENMDTNDPLPSDVRSEARLLDYLKPAKKGPALLLDNYLSSKYEPGDDGNKLSGFFAAIDAESRRSRSSGMPEVVDLFDLSAYPQLAPTKASSQNHPEQFWATMPKSVQSIPYRSLQSNPDKGKKTEKPTVEEEFPKLGKGVEVSIGRNENVWTHFTKQDVSVKAVEHSEKIVKSEESHEKFAARSSKKKNKWRPLAL